MNGIGGTNLTPNNYISNAQHVGMQRGATNITKNEDASLQNNDDSVQLSLSEGPKAGLNSGTVSEKNKAEKKDNVDTPTTPKETSEGKESTEGKSTALVPYKAPENVDFNSGNPGASINSPFNTATPEDMAKVQQANQDMQALFQKFQEIQQEQQKFWMEMMASQQKHMASLWAMQQETATSIYSTVQTVIANASKARMAVADKWTRVLTGTDR